MLLRKPRSYAEVYNDLDSEIVNVFRVARDHGDELHKQLLITPFSRHEFHDAYSSSSDTIEAARKTIIKSFMGFGSNSIQKVSGFRANSNRSGTTPAHDWANYADCFAELVNRLRGVVIENRQAIDVMNHQDSKDTLFYVDPPYVMSTRTDEKQDYKFELTDQQHIELAACLNKLNGMVILSGYPCELYDNELYANWKRIERQSFADGARERTEVIWINQACADALAAQEKQQRMFA